MYRVLYDQTVTTEVERINVRVNGDERNPASEEDELVAEEHKKYIAEMEADIAAQKAAGTYVPGKYDAC